MPPKPKSNGDRAKGVFAKKPAKSAKKGTEVPDPSVPCWEIYFTLYYNLQMSLLYSAMVLSDEKNPALLMLTSAFFAQVLRSS